MCAYPKMILFDYGNTLLYEPNLNFGCGRRELMKFIKSNPNHCTVEDIQERAEQIFREYILKIRALGCDVPCKVANRILYESLGITFSLSPLEQEIVLWRGASAGARMPDAEKIVDYINEHGIRSAVISNMIWSGEALRERIDRLLPNNRFEFIMTSGDYLFRKPNRILFETALKKAALPASEVWFCGDNPQADVEGAAKAGLFPVWYDNEITEGREGCQGVPTCDHLYIREWSELIKFLDGFRRQQDT